MPASVGAGASAAIARRSSAKAQMAFFDERRSYVTVRQVPPNFSQYLSKKSWRCSFCSACFVARAYDAAAWANQLPPGGPAPLVIDYNQSVVYSPA